MILVNDTFICKPGYASKLARLLKDLMSGQPEMIHILTDMTGSFNKVVMVSEYEDLAGFEKSFEKYMQDSDEMKEIRQKMSGYQDMYLTGSREIYRVW